MTTEKISNRIASAVIRTVSPAINILTQVTG